MNGTTLAKGTRVVSIADGTDLGTIDRVYLDPQRKEIVGITFHRGGGLFGGKTSGLIEIGDVHAFGPDAVTVDSAKAVLSEVAADARADDLVDLGDLLGRQVITEGGTILGRVAAVRFGEASHRLAALEVTDDAAQSPRVVNADAIANLGAELVVVAESAGASVVSTARPGAEPHRLFYVVDRRREGLSATG